MLWRVNVCLCGAVLAAACSSGAVPIAEAALAQHAIEAAESSGASEVPRASLHLRMSRDAVKDAERLMQKGKYDEASRALREAEADARVARAVAREEQARQEAEAALTRIAELRDK